MRKWYTGILLLGLSVSTAVQAQTSYTGSAGLGIEFQEGATFVGPSAKYFFTENHAGQLDLGFETGATLLNLLYGYHSEFAGAAGLRWYGGGGLTFIFGSGFDTLVALRLVPGLDYKIDAVPLAFSFDWRPAIALSSNGGDRFSAGNFFLGIKYAFD